MTENENHDKVKDASKAEEKAPRKLKKPPIVARIILSLIKTLGITIGIVFAILIAVLVFLMRPPEEVMRRAIEAAVQKATGSHFALNGLDFRLGTQGKIEFRNLSLAAPTGYHLPLFTLNKIGFSYDTDLLFAKSKKITIKEIIIDRPFIYVEHKAGKLNWLDFLDRLNQNAEKTIKEEIKKEHKEKAKGPPALPDIEFKLKRFALKDFGAYVDMPDQRLVLNALGLDLNVDYKNKDAQANLRVELKAPLKAKSIKGSALALKVEKPERVLAYFDTTMRLDAKLKKLFPAAEGRLDFQYDLKPREIKTKYKLPLPQLSIKLALKADQLKDQAEVEKASIRFDDKELLDLEASVAPILKNQQIDLLLKKLHLPLDTFARYSKVFLPKIKYGGSIDLKNLSVRSPLKPLMENKLPHHVKGRLELNKIWAKAKQMLGPQKTQSATLRGLNSELIFALNGEDGKTRPSEDRVLAKTLIKRTAKEVNTSASDAHVKAVFRFALDHADGMGGVLNDLKLGLSSNLMLSSEKAPTLFASQMQMDLNRASYHDPKLGMLSVGLKTGLEASGNAQTKDVNVKRFYAFLDDLIEFKTNAIIKAEGFKKLFAKTELKVHSFAKLYQKVPASIRKDLPIRSLKGKTSFELIANGRRPKSSNLSPFSLPLSVEAKWRVDQLGVRTKGANLEGGVIDQFNTLFTIKSKRDQILIDGDTKLQSVQMPMMGIALADFGLPIQIAIDKSKVKMNYQLGLARFRQRQSGLSAEGKDVGLKGELKLFAAIEDFIYQKPNARIRSLKTSHDFNLKHVNWRMPTTYGALDQFDVSFAFKHQIDRHKDDNLIYLKGGIKHIKEELQKADIKNIEFAFNTALDKGLVLYPVKFSPDKINYKGDGYFKVAEVSHPAVQQPLKNIHLVYDAGLPSNGPLELKKLAFNVPDLGVHLGLDGKVWDIRRILRAPDSIRTVGLPEFRLNMDTGIASKDLLEVWPGIELRGSAGMKFKVVNTGPFSIRTEGRLLAEDFNLIQSGTLETFENNIERHFTRTVRVNRLFMNVPIVQDLIVDFNQKPPVKVPAPKRSIFKDVEIGPVYRELRPFTSRRGNFRLAGVSMNDHLKEIIKGKTKHSNSRIEVGETVFDLKISDSTFELSQLYMHIFGGDIFAAVQGQIPSFNDLNDPDARLKFDARITNLDLAYLSKKAREKGESISISALMNLKTQWKKRDVSGQIRLTDLTLDTLDKLLVAADPHEINPNIQKNRKTINAFYVKMFKPSVDKVTVWIDHSKANLDIKLGAIWPFEQILGKVLEGMSIRRVALKPFLPQKKEGKHAPKSSTTARSKRRDGWLR